MWLHGKIKKTHTVMDRGLLSMRKEILDILGVYLALFGQHMEFILDKRFAVLDPVLDVLFWLVQKFFFG